MKVGLDTCYIFGLEAGYARYLRQSLLDSGMAAQDIVLNLGKKAGNLLAMPLQRLVAPIDLIVAGPPCPPWSAQGNRSAMNDKRAGVFLRVLQWVVCCIKCCGHIACLLEEVVGITWAADGKPGPSGGGSMCLGVAALSLHGRCENWRPSSTRRLRHVCASSQWGSAPVLELCPVSCNLLGQLRSGQSLEGTHPLAACCAPIRKQTSCHMSRQSKGCSKKVGSNLKTCWLSQLTGQLGWCINNKWR